MTFRKIGNLLVSSVGMGCMGFSHGYGPVPDEDKAIELIRYAYHKGCTFFDTAQSYGNGHNEILVGKAIKPFRDKIVLATKFRVQTNAVSLQQQINELYELSIKRLDTNYLDLFYLHRINPNIPVEHVAYAIKPLIEQKKILGWGLSECEASEILKAHKITPLTAIQSEYSIMERKYEKEVIPLCEKLNIGFVPYSPLASGFLSGKFKVGNQYVGDDVRRVITRYSEENIAANEKLLDLLKELARLKKCTMAQISLAWMLYKKNFIAPIPGMRSESRIDENLGSADIVLTEKEFEFIESSLSKVTIHGNRTDEDIAKLKEML